MVKPIMEVYSLATSPPAPTLAFGWALTGCSCSGWGYIVSCSGLTFFFFHWFFSTFVCSVLLIFLISLLLLSLGLSCTFFPILPAAPSFLWLKLVRSLIWYLFLFCFYLFTEVVFTYNILLVSNVHIVIQHFYSIYFIKVILRYWLCSLCYTLNPCNLIFS